MDPYERFNSFFKDIGEDVDADVDARLNRVREKDPTAWMRLHAQLTQLYEKPAVGTVGQQVRVAREKIQYLQGQVPSNLRAQVMLILKAIEQHYWNHQKQFRELIDFHTLRARSTEDLVNDLINQSPARDA